MVIVWLLPPRERDSRIFFFLALYRANFDDLRPLKANFGTFKHLWGSNDRILAEICLDNFFHHLVNLRFSLDFLGHFMTYHARFLKKKIFFYWSKIALSWVPTS